MTDHLSQSGDPIRHTPNGGTAYEECPDYPAICREYPGKCRGESGQMASFRRIPPRSVGADHDDTPRGPSERS